MEEYYTPNLEEFHVGFEIELYNANGGYWGKYVVTENDRPVDFVNDIEGDCCRVKYLDTTDIKSLGWQPHSERNINYTTFLELLFQKENKYLSFYPSNRIIKIHNNEIYEDNITWFDGKIKNKSELKKIMQQLDI